uniref:SH3 domain-containing protein n=1 Tax=Syphacia muris TaxID=451379 RepID=A0A0N5AG08_9BILA
MILSSQFNETPIPAQEKFAHTDDKNETSEQKMVVSNDEQLSVEDESYSRHNHDAVVNDNKFLVIADLQGADDEDLNIRSGEVLDILATRPDGWWLAKNSKGETGLVPKTFLKLLPTFNGCDEQGRKSEFLDGIASGREDILSSSQETCSFRPLFLSNAAVNGLSRPISSSGFDDWKSGGLGTALENDIHLTCECHLAPRLSESNLGFHDIYWNCDLNKLRKRRVRVSKLIRISKLENVPTELSNARLRLLHVCLFDFSGKTGKQIVSNVHIVKAADKNGKYWNFVSKNDGGQSGLEFSEFFVRSNYFSENVVLMIEATVLHLSNDAVFKEESLGYVKVPLVDKAGECILTNKVYSLTLTNEGFHNHFLKGLSSRSRPKLHFKVADFTKADSSVVDSLPDVIVWNPLYIRMAFCYRRLLGEILIKNRSDMTCAELIADPFLSTFPQVAGQPDLISLLKSLWIIRIKSLGTKISEEEEAEEFKKHYMRTAFVIYKTLSMPEYDLKSPTSLSKRHFILKSFVEQYCLNQNPIKFLAMEKCKPLNIFDLTVDLIGEHAID